MLSLLTRGGKWINQYDGEQKILSIKSSEYKCR